MFYPVLHLAHLAGSVTLFAANPSTSAVALSVSVTTRPRLEFVMTAPNGDLASQTPVLNGEEGSPLALAADGSLPPMQGRFRGGGDADTDSEDTLHLPPRSQAFFVLLAADSASCGGARLMG